MAPDTLPAMAKSAANYVNSALVVQEARANGFHDGIALDVEGFVSEGSGANIFLVQGGRLHTPPIGASILAGVTRAIAIQIATDLSIPVVQMRVPREMLYTADELSEIVTRSARILGVAIAPEASRELASRSRGTPRIANRLLRRVRDFAQVKADGAITAEVCHAALDLLEVDAHGFDESDRRLLRLIIDKFDGGPVGLNSLAAAMGEEKDAIEEIYEPYLVQIGFLDRTSRGRVATARAYEYFGLTAPGKERLW